MQDYWVTGGAVLTLLALSGFFSGSETALTAANEARIHALERDGEKRAIRVARLIEDREKLIGAILLGNNLVNILASAIATHAITQAFGDAGVAIATVVMTLMVLIFAEVLPKTYAIINPDKAALGAARPIGVAVTVFSPMVRLVRLIVRGTLRLFGVSVDAQQRVLTPHDEIRGAIELHHREGGVEKHERDRLSGLLDLRDVDVAEIMVHRKNIAMIDADQPAATILKTVLDSQYTRLPLYRDEQENIVGVLHAKDVLRAYHDADGDGDAIDLDKVIRKPWFTPETTSLTAQLNAFLRRRNHFTLVVDEYGALAGLITLEDILEEIVGDIEDEHDERVAAAVRSQTDGSVEVDGDVSIRELNRALDWSLPDDEAVTVAGLVIHEAQTIPSPGQAFSFHGFRFDVTERRRNQITKLRIRPETAGEDGAQPSPGAQSDKASA